MKKLQIFFFFFIILLNVSFSQTSFTTIPAASSGVINICQGSTILFTNTTSNLAGPTTYSWNFGNGQAANTLGPHAIKYNTVGSYTVSLSMSDQGTNIQPSSITVNVTSFTGTPPSLISGNSCTQSSIVNGFQIFQTQTATTCSCSSSLMGPAISFNQTNNSSIYPTGTTINVYWGGNGNSTNGGGSQFTTIN